MGQQGSPASPFTVAVVQWALHGFNDRQKARDLMEENARRMVATIDAIFAASDSPPRLIVFPVLALAGIGSAMRMRETPIPVDSEGVEVDLLGGDPVVEPIIEACARHDCYVVSSCVEKAAAMPGHRFHTGFMLGPRGLALRSPKVQAPTSKGVSLIGHVFEEYVEAFGLDAVLPVVDTPLGRIGCLVEGEVLVTASTQALAQKGAQIVVHPTAQRNGQGNPPSTSIKQALAYTNGLFWASGALFREIVECREERLEARFDGGACVVAPDGALLAEMTGAGEGFATATIDLDFLARARENQAPHTSHVEKVYRALAEAVH